MKKHLLAAGAILGMLFAACGTTKTDRSIAGGQNDVEKMGYHGSVHSVKIENYVPDTRSGEGLVVGKTSTLEFDAEGRLLSSIGVANVNKTCVYGDNGKVYEIVELYRDIKVHAFHTYDSRGNCTKVNVYKVAGGDSLMIEERLMTYNDKDSILSYHSLPTSKEHLSTVWLYDYDANGVGIGRRLYTAVGDEVLDTEGEPKTHIKIKKDDKGRPVELDKMSMVEDIYTKHIEYNEHGHISKEVFVKPSAEPQVFEYSYTYTSDGRKSLSYTLEDGVKIEQKTYDEAERILVFETLDPAGTVVERTTYTYDKAGNETAQSLYRLDPDTGKLVEVWKEVKTITYH